jgi:hypothetical protein
LIKLQAASDKLQACDIMSNSFYVWIGSLFLLLPIGNRRIVRLNACGSNTTTERKNVMIDKLEQQWIQKISKLLVGKKIVKVEYMNQTDAEEQGWYKRPIQIKLEDETWLTPSKMMKATMVVLYLQIMKTYQQYL